MTFINSKTCPLLFALPSAVHSHGYLKSPKSRNYFAHTDGLWWGGDENTPYPEHSPSALNRGGTRAVCGIIDDRNYDHPKNVQGNPLPPQPQACYKPGVIIDLEVHLTAHHKGHFVYKACPINHGDVPTQDCFDANPLTFVEDVSHNAIKAPNHPDPKYSDRAYIHPFPAMDFVHRFQLPENLEGELVLIQWYYLTANSCYIDGYDDYPFPHNWHPGNIPVCDSIPPDGIGTPEQWWNCAEVKIAQDCPDSDEPPVTTTSTTSSTGGTTTTTATEALDTTTTVFSPNPNCAAKTAVCGPNNPCENGLCCSQWGYCGSTLEYCGECCQNNCDGTSSPPPPPPSPSIPSPTPPASLGFSYNAKHGEDSRLIAYVGNWQPCPTEAQVDAYSHIVIAFAVSYTWSFSKNNCDETCSIAAPPTCNNQVQTDLIKQWRAKGKKVILSFGGAGMGGSWSGDQNNCWDYCFGKENEVADRLVSIIDDQNLDGIDLDYEYCYDIEGTQAGKCTQRSSLYTDAKAQTFLNATTFMLRTKLDVLGVNKGYNRGHYEVTHSPMDSDLTPSTSAYFQILKKRSADLDFLMPQFYNGVTRAHVDGLEGSGVGAISAASMFQSLSNELFDSEPEKVVFGFCISDCTDSNVNGNQAVKIMSDLKTIYGGEFGCNGGAFFWVAFHDEGGAWSDAVVGEVSKTAGCSNGATTSSSTKTPEAGASEDRAPAMRG